MIRPILAPAFCQVAWVVRDVEAAETFFVETMGVSRFLPMDNLTARDTEGMYLGQPGDWVCNLHIAYAGETQIELIQPVSGVSIYHDSLKQPGDAVQHVAHWLYNEDYDAAASNFHQDEDGMPRNDPARRNHSKSPSGSLNVLKSQSALQPMGDQPSPRRQSG